MVVITAVVGGGYCKLALAPKQVEAKELADKIAVAQAQLSQTQGLIATYEGARDAYKNNYATVVRLGKAVPTDDDTRSLLVQLDTSAKRSGVGFDTINVPASAALRRPARPTTPGAVNVGAFSAQPFSLSFSGTFRTLGDFFSRLDRFVTLNGDTIDVRGRLMHVESIALAPGRDGWPALRPDRGQRLHRPRDGRGRRRRPPPATTTTTASATTSTTTAGRRERQD